MPKFVRKIREQEEEESEHIIIKEDSMKERMPPPPPPPISPSTERQQEGILEVLRQVKVNIPLLDMIKQVQPMLNF